jgi:DNA polymerase sigma
MPKKGSGSGVREINDEAKKARIALLQSEVGQLERKAAMVEERARHNTQQLKDLEEQSKGTVAGYLLRKEGDLILEELLELYQELKRVQKEIADRLSLESKGSSMPPLQLPPSPGKRHAKEEKP